MDTDATKALAQMNRTGNSRFMVVDGEKPVGVIALTDWGPEKIELHKKFNELETRCETTWADVSPDDLE